jgi:hypothetical protein
VAGDSGPIGPAAPLLASAVKNREDELTSARMKSTLSKLPAATLATGWPGLPGLAAPEHVSAANELDLDSIPAAPKLFLQIRASLLRAKFKPKLAVMLELTVFGPAGLAVLPLAAVESPLATDTTNATAPPTPRTLCATTSAARPGISGPSGLRAPFLAAEEFRTAVETMSALLSLLRRSPELATLNFQTILTASGLNGRLAPNPAEAVLARDLPSTFATLPALLTLKLAAILASGWNGPPGQAARSLAVSARKRELDEILAAITTPKLKLLLATLDLVNIQTGESGALATKHAQAASPDDSSSTTAALSHLSTFKLAALSDGVNGQCGRPALSPASAESRHEPRLNSAQMKSCKKLAIAALPALSSTGLLGPSARKNARAASQLDSGLILVTLESSRNRALADDLATTRSGVSGLTVFAAASKSPATVESALELATATADLTMRSRNKTATWPSAAT